MTHVLRWAVGVSSAVTLALFLAILTLGKGLGSAYQSGASTEDLVKDLAPNAIVVLLASMLFTSFAARCQDLASLHACRCPRRNPFIRDQSARQPV